MVASILPLRFLVRVSSYDIHAKAANVPEPKSPKPYPLNPKKTFLKVPLNSHNIDIDIDIRVYVYIYIPQERPMSRQKGLVTPAWNSESTALISRSVQSSPPPPQRLGV